MPTSIVLGCSLPYASRDNTHTRFQSFGHRSCLVSTSEPQRGLNGPYSGTRQEAPHGGYTGKDLPQMREAEHSARRTVRAPWAQALAPLDYASKGCGYLV